ncbi:prepilin-type N-terminal cleavage/methylation domain-containing protein [Photobacterium minamisatsumaniensis]|uniref:prepilin-type N-terminal cleavage/methylation domain-containing protein n=1 Tax=Photobacterium minamisatsumaniensis TaxID=2910233 RepID=UPI003D0E0D65
MIRLVIAITVLAIVSLTAYLKMLNIQSDARRATLQTVVSNMHTMSSIVYTKSLVNSSETRCYSISEDATVENSFIFIDDIYTCNGYPTAHIDNVKRAFDIDDDLFITNRGDDSNGRTASISFNQSESLNNQCFVSYTDAVNTGMYIVKFKDSGC